MKTLETRRLLVRNWQQDDLNDLYEHAKVDGVGEMAGWYHHQSKEESRGILEMFLKNPWDCAVVLKENGKVIGSLSLLEISKEKGEEKEHTQYAQNNGSNKTEQPAPNAPLPVQWGIGYVLNKEYWGRGLMPEAVEELIRFCFEELGAKTLWCSHFLSNNQSKRVIEKAASIIGVTPFSTALL